MTNLNLKKFQIVQEVADHGEFLKLCKMFVGYDKSLTVEVSRGFADSIVARLRISNKDNSFLKEIVLVVNIFNDPIRCDVSARLDGLYSHNELYEILQVSDLLENQIEVYLSKMNED